MGDVESLFFFWNSVVLAYAKQRLPVPPIPNKSLGRQALENLPGGQRFTCVLSQLIAREVKCVLFDPTGRGFLDYASILRTSLMTLFPLLIFPPNGALL